MTTNESPNTKIRGSTSNESVRNWDHKHCLCGRIARVNTSWTLTNPGRRFYTCSTAKDVQGCQFFQWVDEGFSGRAFDVITHLNHRRIYLEEKLKLVEENVEQNIEKRRILKEEKMQLIEGKQALEKEIKRLGRQLKLCAFVAVATVVLMLLFW
ncbi:GRF-type domain-containing protein [Heracleum sosnowskyi]|uniref:GRF-type domain-containing protein n=1 Tax=Heracleum sosnowskyi TaxID=360622 RepID=A0AAD8ID40_9APIA|nr:GRF-type domain-containing protein [Heracleum sosnowskyi]